MPVHLRVVGEHPPTTAEEHPVEGLSFETLDTGATTAIFRACPAWPRSARALTAS